MRRFLILTASALILSACGDSAPETSADMDSDAKTVAADTGGDLGSDTTYEAAPKVDTAKLNTILAAQDDAAKARYDARNPAETLAFFGITPGMTVAEALPGGGWYSKILIPYLGPEGQLVGLDYSSDLWSEFNFATPEFIASKANWPTEWPEKTREWVPTGGAKVTATTFGASDYPKGEMDAILFIRALHNFNRFEDDGGYMSEALALAHDMLKPGGIVGVVQHRAPETLPDNWADGSRGYLKQSAVIKRFEEAGFDLVETSEINANPKDQPGEDDIVWRLPPSLNGVGEDEDLRAERLAIGESDRMTLKFKKR